MCDEFIVCSALKDRADGHDENLIAATHSAEAVGDHKARAVGHQVLQGLLDLVLGLGVHPTRVHLVDPDLVPHQAEGQVAGHDGQGVQQLSNFVPAADDDVGTEIPARDGFPKKVKPLVRLTERETAAWCVVRGIDYLVDECPMAVGNKHLQYKAMLNGMEAESPGSKASFYLNFVERMAPLLDEWQRVPAVWDAVRRAVDRRGDPHRQCPSHLCCKGLGREALENSSTPARP